MQMGSYFLIRFYINDAFIVLVYFPLLWKTECIGFFHRDGCNSRCSSLFDIAREWLVCFGDGEWLECFGASCAPKRSGQDIRAILRKNFFLFFLLFL